MVNNNPENQMSPVFAPPPEKEPRSKWRGNQDNCRVQISSRYRHVCGLYVISNGTSYRFPYLAVTVRLSDFCIGLFSRPCNWLIGFVHFRWQETSTDLYRIGLIPISFRITAKKLHVSVTLRNTPRGLWTTLNFFLNCWWIESLLITAIPVCSF